MTEVAREDWVATAEAARDEGFTFFDALTAVDHGTDGLQIVLRLWDVDGRRGRLLTTRCPADDARVPSLSDVYAGAAWHERQVWEMFDIAFDGHPGLRPLLLPDGFNGHPLRKDFVLASRAAKRWPGLKEPGESDADVAGPRRRRRVLPPGVPADWPAP